MSDAIIEVSHLNKDFKLPHQKIGSIKNIFTNIFSFGSQTYETQHALKDISFKIKKGEFFGIVGRNGSGKSTLLKILAGVYQPTNGSVQIGGKVVPFIELGVGFNGELTGRENIYLNGAILGFNKKAIDEKYQEIIDFAELERFMDQKLKNYSSGMQVRLAFSVATRLAESDILLIDEVLAVGDADFQRKCFEYFRRLKREKKTVVFVSHDMNSIREYCDKVILIEDNILVKSGHADEIATQYTKMFLNQSNSMSEGQQKRWGSRAIEYTSLKVEKISRDTVSLKLKVLAKENVDKPNFGFTIKASNGQPILGTNSQIKKLAFSGMSKGERLEITWSFPNILNDGDYFLEPAVIGLDGQVFDWWEEALRFEIRKEERTPYLVSPTISLKLEKQEAKD